MKTKKTCADCKLLKDPEEFHVNRATGDGRHYYCKKCQNKRGNKWRTENLDKARAAVRKSYRKNYTKQVYGIDRARYETMLEKQKGKCPICRKKLKRPSIDHCHSTGKVRGVLCRHCNSSLSVFENDPDAVLRLIDYLGLTIPFGPHTATD